MIEIVEEKKKTKRTNDPYYLLVYDYMIGDANGDTKETVNVSLNNPFVERYVTLLNSLKPTKGTWGLGLDQRELEKCWNEKQLEDEDYAFLKRMMFEDEDEEPEYFADEDNEPVFVVDKADEDFANEFADGVRSDTEYSFLVFQGADLFYINEFGKKFDTKFV